MPSGREAEVNLVTHRTIKRNLCFSEYKTAQLFGSLQIEIITIEHVTMAFTYMC